MTFVQNGNSNIEVDRGGSKEIHPPGTIHPAERTLFGEESDLQGTSIVPPYCDPDDYFGPGFTARAVAEDRDLNPFSERKGSDSEFVVDL